MLFKANMVQSHLKDYTLLEMVYKNIFFEVMIDTLGIINRNKADKNELKLIIIKFAFLWKRFWKEMFPIISLEVELPMKWKWLDQTNVLIYLLI